MKNVNNSRVWEFSLRDWKLALRIISRKFRKILRLPTAVKESNRNRKLITIQRSLVKQLSTKSDRKTRLKTMIKLWLITIIMLQPNIQKTKLRTLSFPSCRVSARTLTKMMRLVWVTTI